MQRRFANKGFIARFKPVHNGYLMSVGVLSEQKRAKPSYQWVAIWGEQARAIAPQLRKGRAFAFGGNITRKQKDGRTFHNHTIDRWQALPPRTRKTIAGQLSLPF